MLQLQADGSPGPILPTAEAQPEGVKKLGSPAAAEGPEAGTIAAQFDYQFSPTEFADIQTEFGPFDVDLTADGDGSNSQCADYCSAWSDPRDRDLTGLNCWSNPPFEPAFVCDLFTHYFDCKSRNPEGTSACFVLPLWDNAAWQPLVQNMRAVRYYPRGTMLFTGQPEPGSDDRKRVGPIRWPVVVYRDDHTTETPAAAAASRLIPAQCSLSAVSANASSTAPILLHGTANKKPCSALVDCGASQDFVSRDFVRQHGLQLTGNPADCEVRLPNGEMVSCGERCKVSLRLQGYRVQRECLVADLPGHQVILGMPWLVEANPSLDFRRRTVTVRQQGRTFQLFSRPDYQQPASLLLLTAKQLQKQLRRDQVDRVELVLLSPLNPDGPIELPADTPEPIRQLLQRFGVRVFPQDLPKGVPPDRGFPHRIELEPGQQPPSRQPYRLSPKELDELRGQLKDLIDHDFIQPSTSPYGAPVIFVQKKDGSQRMCIDYRALNKITIKNRHPLPRIDELLDRIFGAKWFTKIDLRSGYFQVPMALEDIPKTAFRTRYGHFEFRVMPFGLTNAPATFQAMMNSVLDGLVDKCVVNLLDDILIYSNTLEEHVQHLEAVLQRLEQHQLYAKLSKCEFARKELEFVGFNVSADGLKPTPGKVQAVQEWPEPKTVKELRSFLGFCNFYRRFIRDYASTAAPLTDLTKEGAWTGQLSPAARSAFGELKAKMTTAPVLLNPDFDRPFTLHVDASDYAVGAILLQDQGSGLQPVAYDSKKLSDTERRWASNEKEAYSLVHACRVFRPYIDSRHPFVVRSDNTSVTHLLTKPTLTKKQARWVEELSQYHFSLEHIAGKDNTADPLSRRPVLSALTARFTAEQLTGKITQQLSAAYWRDDFFLDPANREGLECRGGLWFKGSRLVIPADEGLRRAVLEEMHDCPLAAHRGIEKTTERLKRYFWWDGLPDDAREYVRSCPACQRNKPSNQPPAGLLQPIPAPTHRWQQVTMDLITHLPASQQGNDAIFVVVDRLSKFARFIPCRTTSTAADIAMLFLQHIISNHGMPATIISDRDQRWAGFFWSALTKLLGTRLSLSTAYHPQTDGQTERTNRTLEEMLRNYVNGPQDDWESLLPLMQFAYNDSESASTGQTPFFLTYGEHPRSPLTALLPIDDTVPAAADFVTDIKTALDRARASIAAAQQRQKQQADKSRRDIEFAAGDDVYLSTTNIKWLEGAKKLLPPWIPAKILRKVSAVAYEVELPDHWRVHPVFHVSLLKPAVRSAKYPREQDSRPGPVNEDGDQWEAEKIVGERLLKRQQRRTKQYKVRFKGFGPESDLWLPVARLRETMPLLIRDWERGRR